MYADILILNRESNHDQILTYLIPADLRIDEGCLVVVPIRNTLRKGLVISIEENAPDIKQIKPILKVVDEKPALTKKGLALANWLSSYYVCSINKAVQPFLPPPVRVVPTSFFYILEDDFLNNHLFASELEGTIIKYIRDAKKPARKEIVRRFGPSAVKALDYLLKYKIIGEKTDFNSKIKEKVTQFIKISSQSPLPEEIMKKAPKQGEILLALQERPIDKETLKKRLGSIDAALKALIKKEWVEIIIENSRRRPYTKTLQVWRPAKLNEEQLFAVNKISDGIKSNSFKELLLYGVTGSGKTEVYLKVIEEILARGKQALYLVPEISLTPQVISLVLSVFGDQAALLHSSLSPGERYDEWLRIKSGEARVIVGPRSALFAPFTDLGLIIIDEEHENTYKQNEPDPRYDARTTAAILARLSNAVLVMGSATPSLKSYYHAHRGDYELLSMTHRIENRPLPALEIVDMKRELEDGNRSIFSRILKSSLEQVIARGEQAILFINRRGYHTFILCRECGKVLNCPNCSITLTYHQDRGKLKCHYCDFSRNLPDKCPSCGSRYIRYFGSGTERIAKELETLFPQVGFLRMDRDTTRLKGSHTNILKEFQEGKAQVLIGTQMIAKGFDFPRVTLVGIVNPDALMNMPDYQASERAFQLITQVAGRAGRGTLEGKVLVQTYNPDHYIFESVINQDYHDFYMKEIANREMMFYPPYQSLARVLVSGTEQKKVQDRVDYFKELLKIEIGCREWSVEILGPSEAPLFFLKGRYRYHFILRGQVLKQIQELAWIIKDESLKLPQEPRIIIDVEPQSLL